MPFCAHCKNPLGKRKKFESNKFNSKYCLEVDECISAWRADRINGLPKQKEVKRKADTKQLREKIKTKSDYEKDLQKEINAIVKHLDKGWGCIATDTLQGKRNAGHYFSIGSNPTLRFHLENIWNQSEHSNSFKSGDVLRYQDGLARLYGSEYLTRLNRLKSIQPIKLSIDDLKDKIKEARKVVAELKESDRVYSLSERLEMRQKINERLAIYAA